MDHQFRNAVFGGFNRQDVLDYLETLARENAQKRQELEQSIGRAEGERDELRAQKQALEEQKRALEGEKELNLCCFFLWRFKRVPVFMAGTFVIFAGFQIARLMQGCGKVNARLA